MIALNNSGTDGCRPGLPLLIKAEPMNTSRKRSTRDWLALTGITLALATCAAAAHAVGIRTLNYTSRDLNYIAVEQPGKPDGGGGGDGATPFSSGGHVCCFGIPDQWHPGLQVVVVYQLEPEMTGYRRKLVDVPPYAGGEAGDIWLIVYEDESVEAVVSNYGPSRPEWPGRVKGYPEPTREYRLKRWEIKLEREKIGLAGMEKARSGDIHDLTPEQLTRLDDAIKHTREMIQRMEANKP
jgi:hypothetical protein